MTNFAYSNQNEHDCCQEFNQKIEYKPGDHKAVGFSRREDGAGIVMALLFFLAMLIAAGLGVDFMRQEMERTNIQATLDVAVLAAAGSEPDSTADEIKAVVEDYFDKFGMSELLNEIPEEDITATINSKSVTASADVTLDTYLLPLVGIRQLSASAISTAQVRVPALEVVMVLDVSGSMGNPSAADATTTKLDDLKAAGKEFVTRLLDGSRPTEDSEPESIAISIVPFSTNVTPSDEIYAALTVNETHQNSTCLDFETSDFSNVAIDPEVAQEQSIFTSRPAASGSPNGDPEQYSGLGNFNQFSRTCYTNEANKILAYSDNETVLHDKIDSLTSDGYTSAELGVKWGTALLDPAFQSVSEVAASSDTITNLDNVPAPYDDGDREVQKVIVVLSDGANTQEDGFNFPSSNFRGAGSPMLRLVSNGRLFMERAVAGQYRDFDNNTNISTNSSNVAIFLRNNANDPSIIQRLSWEQMWGEITPAAFSRIDGVSGTNSVAEQEFENNNRGRHDASKDARMDANCNAAETEGVIIYSIGFDVPSGGTAEAALNNCASGRADEDTGLKNNYFAASDGEALDDAFETIANNVNKLRLTQ